jgi:baseplate J-like protein
MKNASPGKALGTTALNRPHQGAIHYSAKGYDEYVADLAGRLRAKGFVFRENDDFLNAFVDLTGYLGEVLMTYQNAYAQEVFLETTQLRESLYDLAMMVDFRIDPGAAAVGKLVILAKQGKAGTVPKGFPVSGKEENAKESVFFETDAELAVAAAYNELKLADRECSIPVGESLESLTILDKAVHKPGQFLFFENKLASQRFFAMVDTSVIDETAGTTQVTLKNLSPSISDTVENGEWSVVSGEARGLLKMTTAGSKSDLWLDDKVEGIRKGAPLVLRSSSTGINYGTIDEVSSGTITVKTGVATRIAQYTTKDPDIGTDETEKSVFTIQTVTGKINYHVVEKTLSDLREVARLTVSWLDTPPEDYEPDPALKSPGHLVFAGGQTPLTVVTKAPTKEGLQGALALTVEGDLADLEKNRLLILTEQLEGQEVFEEVRVAKVLAESPTGTARTRLELKQAIGNKLTKYGVKIWGNVVAVTQGKTLPRTVLGSGYGEVAYQAFDLPAPPLTFERRGREGLKGAIELSVGDLPWEQKNDFLASGPGDRHFVVQTDFEARSRIILGDGINGARATTGSDNVVALIRSGQGTQGNLPARILKKPVSKPAFLEELFNPRPTVGGADPDQEAHLRKKIPVEHLTFDRAVSLQDYADLALSYPCIGKAKAGWRWRDHRQFVILAVAGAGGTDVTPLLKDLRDFVDARRDVHQPLLIKPVEIVPIELTLVAVVASDFDAETVGDAVVRALGTGINDDGAPQFFNFERLDMGMSIHKKDVYRVVGQVPGIREIKKLELRRGVSTTAPTTAGSEETCLTPAFCTGDVWINNWELAVLDLPGRSITMTQPAPNSACERWGG